jgi:hypothetical protein
MDMTLEAIDASFVSGIAGTLATNQKFDESINSEK